MFENYENLIREGKWEEAETALLEFVERHPEHPKGHVLLGLCLGRKGDIDGASVQFQRAWALDPNDSEAGKNLLKCYEYMGKHKEALDLAQTILKARPSDTEITGAIGRLTTILHAQEPLDDHEKVWGR